MCVLFHPCPTAWNVQIVQPQKRRVIRHVLEGTMGRILELKNEMVQLELLEYHYFDDILVDMKLTPVGRVGLGVKGGAGRLCMYVRTYVCTYGIAFPYVRLRSQTM